MYDMNEILARLQKGEDAETIGAEFAEALNQAVAKQDALQKEAELKAKETLAKSEKRAAMLNVIAALAEYAEKYADAETAEKLAAFGTDVANIDFVCEQVDAMFELRKTLTGLAEALDHVEVEKPEQPVIKMHKADADLALKRFLREMGL